MVYKGYKMPFVVHYFSSMAQNFELLTLKRNGQGYLVNDQVFIKTRERANTLYLRCSSYRSGCKATAKIADNQAFLVNEVHNHLPPNVSAMRFRAAVSDKVKDPVNAKLSVSELYDSAKKIALDSATSNLQRTEMNLNLPTFSAIKTSLYASRSSILPKEPTSLAEIDGIFLSQSFRDSDGNSFLLEDTGPIDPSRILIFGDRTRLPHLRNAESLQCDGTFYVTPTLFSQFYTIHCEIYGQSFPIFYVLLPGKTQILYRKMFDAIFRVLDRFNVRLDALRYVISDFESGLIPVVSHFFPGQIHKGCNFHFSQALYRKIQEMGFQRLYRQNQEFRSAVRQFIALGHVPTADKMQFYHHIMFRFANVPQIGQFADYFYRTWFGRYRLEMWDWYNMSVRTNNVAEAFHSGLKIFFKQPHMGFNKFINFLFDRERTFHDRFTDRLAGRPLPPVNSTYAELDGRIRRLHAEYPTRRAVPDDYLIPISFCCPDPFTLDDDE